MRILHIISAIYFSAFFISPALAQQGQKGNSPWPEPMHSAPIPEFSVLDFCYGDTTYFINQTIRNSKPNWIITTTGWHAIDTVYNSFTSAKKDIDTNFAFKFPYPGSYTVTLTADNGHYVTITKVLDADSLVSIHADFSFQQCSNQFVNMSSCSYNFHWDFGDGSTSTAELPAHQYPDTGSYIVTLITSNGSSSDTLTQSIYVYYMGFSTSAYYVTQHADTVFFHSTDMLANAFYWSFGDATYATGKDSVHVYKDTVGDFLTSLLTINNCGMHTSEKMIHIPYIEMDTTALSVIGYPSPVDASGTLHYVIYSTETSGSTIAVYDMLGHKVIEQEKALDKGRNTGTLNIAVLRSGMYTLHVVTENNKKCYYKFLVERK